MSLDRNRSFGLNVAFWQAAVETAKWLPFGKCVTYFHEICFFVYKNECSCE